MDKLVSIILPTYNGVNRIGETLASILSQTYSHWELIVIDDGSTDGTDEVVSLFAKKDERIKYIKNEVNQGVQKTLNRGLREAAGEYVARIDDDDTWIDAQKLKEQVAFLEKNKEYVLIGTGMIVVDEYNKELFRYLPPEMDGEIRNNILSKNCFIHSSILFRKAAAVEKNGYSEDPELKHIEDYDLWLKLGTVGKVANLRTYGIKFTLRKGSISADNKIEQFKKNLSLIRNYKKAYPHYFSAVTKSMLRIVLYSIVLHSPLKYFMNRILKIYKENW